MNVGEAQEFGLRGGERREEKKREGTEESDSE
jgi:hypothetical protein